MSIRIPRRELSSNKSITSAISPSDVSITGFSVLGTDDLALDPAGGQTVVIRGKGFRTGATVQVGSNVISVVTVVDSTTIQFSSEALPSGLYNVYVINPNNSVAILAPGLPYSGNPVFVTESGSLGDYYETATVSETIEATEGNDTIRYAVTSGALPAGTTLFANGLITGTAPVENSSNTYSFTIAAIDEENQSTTRSFSLTVNRDVVTWSAPSDGQQYNIEPNTAISNISLSASAASGNQVSYAANSLPTGITLSGDVIHGTPDANAETSITVLTATAANTNRSATRTINWSVQLSDIFFNDTVLLVNADDNTFITDASDNAFTITPVADTRPSAFSPYNTSWSNFFDGTGDYLTSSTSLFNYTTANAASQTFTIEAWVYHTARTTPSQIYYSQPIAIKGIVATGGVYMNLGINGSGNLIFYHFNGGQVSFTGSSVIPLSTWTHVAVVVSGGTATLYVNGVSDGSGTWYGIAAAGQDSTSIFGFAPGGSTFNGYISNLRVSSNARSISVPVAPYANDATTDFLTCQSNRLIDNSTNNFTITRNGDVKVTAFAPFTETDTGTGSGYFDGTGDYLTVNNFNGSLGAGNYTIEFWFNTNDTNNFEFFAPTVAFAGPAIIGIGSTTLAVQYGYGSGTGFSWTTGNVFDNNWHHLALVRNGTTVTLYVDGVSRASGTNSPVTDYSGVTTNWTLGFGNQGAGRIYLGYMSNFRVVAGTAVYTSAFTPPAAPVTAVSGTQLLTLQSRIGYNNSQPIDESGIRNIITRVGNASAGTFSPHVPTGWSAYFDGNGDSLTVGPSAEFTFGTGDWTVEYWVYLPTWTGLNTLVNISNSSNPDTPYGFIIRSSSTVGQWQIYIGDGATWAVSGAVTSTGPGAGVWQHHAHVRSSGTYTMYIDGVSRYSVANSTNLPYTYAHIGRYVYFATGYLSDFRVIKGTAVYTSAFTPPTAPLEPIAGTSLLTLRGTGFTDDSANRFAITRNGDTKITPFSPFAPHTRAPDSHSVYFDGTGDYFTSSTSLFNYTTANAASQTFTIEAWVYHTARTTPPQIYYSQSIAGKGDVYLNFGINGSGNLIFHSYSGIATTITGSSVIPLNTWTHVAVVVSGGTSTLYVNGVSAGSGNWGGIDAGGQNSTSFFGTPSTNAAAQAFRGYISNIRVSSNARSISVPVAPFTNDATTDFLTCQSPTVTDNSSNAFAITVGGNTQPTRFNPFGETVATGVEYAPASHGGSVYFDGTGDYVAVDQGETGLENWYSQDYTIEMWVYPTVHAQSGINATGLYVVHGVYNTATAFWSLGTTSTGLLRWLYYNGGVVSLTATDNALPLSVWSHVALVYTHSTGAIKGYVNGVEVFSGTKVGTPLSTSTNDINIGVSQGTYYTGHISNLRIVKGTAVYTSAFVPPAAPATPIAGTTLLINGTNAAIQDRTGRHVLETVGNARVANGVKKFGSGAMYFDGTGDWLTCPGSQAWAFGTGNFTIECWFYTTAVSTRGHLVANRNSTDSWELLTYNSKVYFGNGTTDFLIQSDSLSNGTWYHIAVSRSGTSLKLFIDGVEKASATNSTNFSNATNVLGIGALRDTGQYPLNGYIDDLRITRGVARYTASFTPPSRARLK